MKDRDDNLGDTPPEIFREQLHRLADWIADYRGKMETLRVAPDSKPGAIRAALPSQPPEQGEPFEKILADVDRVILPGMVHWSHPMFLAYFGWTATAPGILSEMISAPLNVNAMTWRTCPAATELETAGDRLAAPMDAFAKKFRWRGLRYRLGRDHACACRGPRRGRALHSQTWSDRTRIFRDSVFTRPIKPTARLRKPQSRLALAKKMCVGCQATRNFEWIRRSCANPSPGSRVRIQTARRCCHSRNHLNRERGSSCRNRTSLPRRKDVAACRWRLWRRLYHFAGI